MRKWISEAMAAVFCLLAISALIHLFLVFKFNITNYLPAPSYAMGELTTLYWVSLATGVILSAVWLGPGVVKAYRRRPHMQHNQDAAAVGIALLTWWWAYIFFVSTGPLALSYITGEKQTFTYTVNSSLASGNDCRGTVRMENLSVWNDTLCHASDDIRDQLSRCDKVTVEGVGTRFGLRVTQIIAVHPSGLEDRISSFEDCPA